MTPNLNKLNTMNYQVTWSEGHYCFQNGLRSLHGFSTHHNLNFKALCKALLSKGYFTFKENGEITEIVMI